MIRTLLIAAIVVGAGVTAVEARQRIDVYDKNSRREGYIIVDERRGRADFFDKYSRRKGYATFPRRRPVSQEQPARLAPFKGGPRR